MSEPASDDHWERHAQWWIDHFTDGADPEYEEQILPLVAAGLQGATRVLDVGCGEGQVSRLAAALPGMGLAVGLDPTAAQLAAARRRGGGAVRYVRGGATALPFAPAAFDAVVACLVLEHVDDLDAAIGEVARVLAPGGRFHLLLNHPLIQTPGSGWIDDRIVDPPEQYWRVGPYLVETATVEEVELGVHIRFVHRPLSRYLNTLTACGLVLEHVAEPAPPPGFLALAPEYADAATIPRLLYLRTRREADR